VVVLVLLLHQDPVVLVDLVVVEEECGQVHLLVLLVQEHKHHLVDLLHLRVMVVPVDLNQLVHMVLAQVVEEQIQQELLVVL